MPTPSTAADTIGTIIPFIEPLATKVMQLTHTDPGVVGHVQTALDGIHSGLDALATSETANESAPIVARILADSQAVLQVAAGLPLPFPYNIILMAASGLLPALVGTVNMLMASKVTVATVA